MSAVATATAPLSADVKYPTYAQVQGRVIAFKERNGYDDSDFSSLVAFDAEDGGYTFGWVETGSTRYAGGYIAKADCTDTAILAAYAEKRAAVMADLAADRAAREARTVAKGKGVTVVKAVTRGKNKVAAGETGVVTWRGVDQYNSSRHYTAYRVGVRIDSTDAVIFLSEDNVRVTGFEAEDLPIDMTSVDYLIAGCWPSV